MKTRRGECECCGEVDVLGDFGAASSFGSNVVPSGWLCEYCAQWCYRSDSATRQLVLLLRVLERCITRTLRRAEKT